MECVTFPTGCYVTLILKYALREVPFYWHDPLPDRYAHMFSIKMDTGGGCHVLKLVNGLAEDVQADLACDGYVLVMNGSHIAVVIPVDEWDC